MSDIRPASPGSSSLTKGEMTPADLDPELQTLAMVKDLRKDLDSPSEITKVFAVRKALCVALNNTETNRTGYDATGRIVLFSSYEKSSLNIDAKLFNSFMAFLMKPKMIIQGMPMSTQEKEEPGFFSRAIARFRGKDPKQEGDQK